MATSNAQYAAYIRHGNVYVEGLTASERDQGPRCLPVWDPSSLSVLSLSTLQPHLLAISRGSQILVYDILNCKLVKTLDGAGRTVTALAWSATQANILLSGAVDGRIALWDLDSPIPGSPTAQLRLDGLCQAIECCPADARTFASVHDGRVVITKHVSAASLWRLRALRAIKLDNDAITSVSWHPEDHSRLLIGTRSGRICLCDVASILDATANVDNGRESESSDSEDGFFGKLDGVDESLQNMREIAIEDALSKVQWVGKRAFLCLTSDGARCSIWSWQQDAQKVMELWSSDIEGRAASVSIVRKEEGVVVTAVGSMGISELDIPQGIVSKAGVVLVESDDISKINLGEEVEHHQQYTDNGNGMLPIPISAMKAAKGGFARTSKQLRQRRPSFERKQPRAAKADTQRTGHRKTTSPPAPTSMTSSLELPKHTEDEGSPMPFLSPSIPSQKPSPSDFTTLDDSIRLPPLPRASFDSSLRSTSAATQESDDSDDETFVDGMQGSASFLPGGINVPLPKACAALFTPTGELLTFFPPKPKLTARRGEAPEEKQADPKANAKKVARLFPMFGNLAGEPTHMFDEDSDSGFESTSSVSSVTAPLRHQPSFSFFPSSYPSQQSWKSRISPTKHSFTEQTPHKVIVSLHDISGVGALLPATRQLASRYRIVCDPEESASDLCRHNADVSEMLGLDDIAGIWRLVIVLLKDPTALEAFTCGQRRTDVLALARVAQDVVRNDSLEVVPGSWQHKAPEQLRWTNFSSGAAWIVHAIFEWAECQADVQMLAVLSAILAQTQEAASEHHVTYQRNTTAPLPLVQRDYFGSTSTHGQTLMLANRSIPTFSTDSSATSAAVYESPGKPKRASAGSSRNQSQPTTPYLDSEPGSPPLALPALGRQGSRLSASGSASPEHHRSSFSAAAKYYAQSISDKFASYGAYGSSPPARKALGTSPSNTNELSTSFPSGSWGKSVSFASTTNTTKASLLSTSFEDVHEDEGYDSDKTVEDLSQPQTPKDNGECIVTFKNDRLFDSNISGGSDAVLLSDDIIPRCRRWCAYYCEQLRSWDLLSEAAELDKVCGTTCLRTPTAHTAREEDTGIVPALAPHGSKACSICSIKMTGAQFFCPSCSHSAHVGCLEDFITALYSEDGEAFSCPTGCGCKCDDLPFEIATVEPVKEERPKKKANFTDPRRWRARVEGDSW